MSDSKLKHLCFIRRILFILIILYIVLFFVLKASALSPDNSRRFIFDLKYALSNKKTSDNILFWDDNISKSAIFKDGLVTLTDNTISIYSSGCYKYSSHSIVLHTPILRVTDGRILAYDRSGYVAYIFDSFNLIKTINTQGSIIDAGISDNGYVYIITDSYGYKGRLTVYNKKLEEVFYWDSSEDYLYTASFVDNDIYVVTLVPDNENINTQIRRIDYSKGKELNKYCVEGALPVQCCKKNNNTFELIADNGIYAIDNNNCKKIYSFTNSPKKIVQTSDFVAFSCVDSLSSDSSTLTLVDKTGKKLFSSDYSVLEYLQVADGKVYLISNGDLYVLDTLGNILLKQSLDIKSCDLVTNGNIFMLIDGDRAYKINVK